MKKRKEPVPMTEAFLRNEAEANREMCFICLASAGAILVALIFYIFKVFPLADYRPVWIGLPILIAILLQPAWFLKFKPQMLQKQGFKYFVLLLILAVAGTLNVLLPRHVMLAYAFVIILVNHYYSPKLGRIIFALTLATMLVCLYAGAFFGEYDSNLLTDGIRINPETGVAEIYQPQTPQERVEFLNSLLAQGENRYVRILTFYYFARALVMTMIYLASAALHTRTRRLMEREAVAQADKARIVTELTLAEEIQRTVLPSATYQNRNVEIFAQLRPARSVGGDFYDYWFPDENHVAVLIGDVSGKGIPAAMFMMKTLTSFRASYSLGVKPSEVIKKVNSLIVEGNDANMFVTCFFGVLDVRTGMLEYCNGGHNAPALIKGHRAVLLPCDPGMILGAQEEALVVDEVCKLGKGDGLLLYTDGITEARAADGELFGEKRLLDFLSHDVSVTLVERGHDMEDRIAEFCAGAEQSDDITYLNLVYQGTLSYFEQKSFPVVAESAEGVRQFIAQAGEKAKISKEILSIFYIASDEIISNIVKYSQAEAGSEILVRCVYKPEIQSATVTIVDRGIPFDPTVLMETTVDQREENAKPGGLGWLMVKNMMDEVVYHRSNGKNVVSITKKVQ